jgi:uncharacterized membrane protein
MVNKILPFERIYSKKETEDDYVQRKVYVLCQDFFLTENCVRIISNGNIAISNFSVKLFIAILPSVIILAQYYYDE